MKFHRLKLFGFFVIREREGQVRCPQVALFPDECYGINTAVFFLKYSSRSWQSESFKSQIKKHPFKKNNFCSNFTVFSFDFSEEILSVLKPLKMSSRRESLVTDGKQRLDLDWTMTGLGKQHAPSIFKFQRSSFPKHADP